MTTHAASAHRFLDAYCRYPCVVLTMGVVIATFFIDGANFTRPLLAGGIASLIIFPMGYFVRLMRDRHDRN